MNVNRYPTSIYEKSKNSFLQNSFKLDQNIIFLSGDEIYTESTMTKKSVDTCFFLQICRFISSMLETATGAWIGLNDRESESRYVWNFQKYPTQSYFPWGNGEPSNYNGNCNIENCVVIKSSGEWNDVICDSFNPYICQVSSIYNGEIIVIL